MNELSRRARGLIESAMRYEEGPSVAELGRVRRSVLSGLAASGAVAGAASTTLLAKAAAAVGSTAGQVAAYAVAGALAAGATLAVHETIARQPSPGAAVGASMAQASRAAERLDRAGAVPNVAATDGVGTSFGQPNVGLPSLAPPTTGSTHAPSSAGLPDLARPITTTPSTPSALGSRAAFDARGSRPPGSSLPNQDVSSLDGAFASAPGEIESAPGGAALARPSGDLARQLAYLHAMRTELHAGNAGRALELSRESEALFPGSALEAEARAARITALCLAGQSVEARGAIERFRALFPKSALLRNVEHGCTIGVRKGTGH
jgi:hypothetical protein